MGMHLQDLFEAAAVRLSDLYDEAELRDEMEMLTHYLDDDDLQRAFDVHVLTPEQAKTYTTPKDNTTVWQAYRQFATREQKRVVREKARHYDANRIIVTMHNTVIDGNHQLIAGILAKQPIKYINLADPKAP